MSERVERCSRCKWWEMHNRDDGADPDMEDFLPGTCHRYPPVFVEEWCKIQRQLATGRDQLQSMLDAMSSSAAWQSPTTDSDHFCGEFAFAPIPLPLV